MIALLLSVVFCTAVHVLAMALYAMWIGIEVREVAVGVGPILCRRGRFRLAALPVSGYVRMRSAREEEVPADEMHTTLEGQSIGRQLGVMLFGCAALLAIAVALAGADGLRVFAAAQVDFVAGALSPLGEAQRLLGRVDALTREASEIGTVVGLVAAYVGGVNLLPLPMFNGGAAIAALARRAGLDRFWPSGLTRALAFVWPGMALAWLLALGVCFGGG